MASGDVSPLLIPQSPYLQNGLMAAHASRRGSQGCMSSGQGLRTVPRTACAAAGMTHGLRQQQEGPHLRPWLVSVPVSRPLPLAWLDGVSASQVAANGLQPL